MKISFYSHSLFESHHPGAGHPERPERLQALWDGLKKSELVPRLDLRTPQRRDPSWVSLVHSSSYLARLKSTRGKAVYFDGDTRSSPETVDAALLAAGAVTEAVDLVLEDPSRTAFLSLRPPGHHAESYRAMGFCFINNAAVGAAYALKEKGLERVFIFDPDVHHGKGTQEIFYSRRDVLYSSIHQYPFYPGTGTLQERGEGEGLGFNVNFPLSGSMGDAEYSYICRTILRDMASEYKPQLMIFSAGFDAHEWDPLGGMNVTSQGFLQIYGPLVTLAREENIPFLFVLEGGYSLAALEEVIPLLFMALEGENFPVIPQPDPWPLLLPMVEKIRSEVF